MQQNGRVHILDEGNTNQFELYDKIPLTDKITSYKDALVGNWTESPLSCAFFSAQNIQILQNGIRAKVYNVTEGKHTIPEQNIDTLKIIMRSIFLEHSANLPYAVEKQIEDLNKLVYNYAVPQIVGEIDAYIKYLNDVSYLPVPLAHPKLQNCKDKTLELKNFF
jgi:hypothetical protein